MASPRLRTITVAIAIALAATVLAACGSSSEEGGGGGEENGPITIGFATAQSGAFASYDKPAVDGAKLEIEKINAEGGIDGRKIKVVEADTRTDINGAREAADEVLANGAQFMMVTCDFDYSTPSIVEAQSHNVVAMSPCAGSTKFRTDVIGPNGFSMGTGVPAEGASQAEFASEKLKAKTAYVIVDPTIDIDKQSGAAFEQRWKELGGTIVGTDVFQQEDQSFSAQISRLRELPEPPDVIYLASYPPGGVRFVRSLRAAGIESPILAESNFDGSYWLKSVPGLSDFYHTAYGSMNGDDPEPAVNQVMAEYTKKYGKPETEIGALSGYSVIEALKRAYEKAGTTEASKLVPALEEFHNEKLAIGPTTFDKLNHITLDRPVRIIQVQNGKESLVGLWKPKKVPVIE
ncbi:MAG: ABC transporter substrate-binding protein [Actinobacteria bacterium]|nr:ABC transporter substrate-binding protein [Actinomycetota bacterium]